MKTGFVAGKYDIEGDFEIFFIENYPKMKAFAIQILKSEEDAEDICQDIFMKLIDRPEIWNDNDIKDRYLFKMVKNAIFNFLKHKKVEYKHQTEVVKLNKITDEFGIEDKLHAKEIELLIMHTICQMPERRKQIFTMSRFEGKKNAEISEELDMSIRTVERHLYLALSDIKKMIFF